jgi:hypothetical protein
MTQIAFDSLKPASKVYLSCKSREELISLWRYSSDALIYKARDYLRRCDISELPKYISHPCIGVTNIVKERLVKGR